MLEEKKIRVGINAHLLSGEAGYRRAGIHQYIYQVLTHLPADTAVYTIYTNQPQLLAETPHLQTAVSRLPTANPIARILWEQLIWPLAAIRARTNLIHSMAFVTPLLAPCPSVVTVYDLSFMHFPERFPTGQRLYLQSQTRRACRHARRVITISESARQDVHRLFNVPLSHIDAIVPGVDPGYKPAATTAVATFRARHQLPEHVVLHVGTLQPRKNLPVLLEAFAHAHLPADTLLVLVGGKGWFYDEIFQRVTALGIADRVRFTGYVPDDEIPLWYNAASLLALPSIYEGFGMPVIEAMACGTPVLAANTSSLPEAGGTAARYFAPDDVAKLAELLTAVLTDPTLAATMRRNGLAQAQTFSWEKAGRETAKVYAKALS